MNEKLVIYGIGTFTNTIFRHIQEEHELKVVAFVADKKFIESKILLGLPLVPFEEVEQHYPPDEFDMMALVGYKRMRDRKKMFDAAKAKGYHMPNLISPTAEIHTPTEMGENNIISGQVYVGPFCSMGNNVIIRPAVYLGHDSIIRDHCFISPGCKIAGFCNVGELSFLGLGSILVDNTALQPETYVGPASLVSKNTDPCTQYAGIPAKKIGEHHDTGIIILH